MRPVGLDPPTLSGPIISVPYRAVHPHGLVLRVRYPFVLQVRVHPHWCLINQESAKFIQNICKLNLDWLIYWLPKCWCFRLLNFIAFLSVQKWWFHLHGPWAQSVLPLNVTMCTHTHSHTMCVYCVCEWEVLTQLGAGSREWNRSGNHWWGQTRGWASVLYCQLHSHKHWSAQGRVPLWCCPGTRNRTHCDMGRPMTSANHHQFYHHN